MGRHQAVPRKAHGEEMKKDVFMAQMSRLLAEYSDKNFSDARMELWWEELHCLPSGVFIDGVAKLIRTRPFPDMPTLGAVLEASIGEHSYIVSSRMKHGGVKLDDIHAEYKLRYLNAVNRVKIMQLDDQRETKSEVDVETVESVKLELAISERMIDALNHRVLDLQNQLEVQTVANRTLSERLEKAGSDEYKQWSAQRKKLLDQQTKTLQTE